MDHTETQSGNHWSLTLLGVGLIVMFAYYGESVLAVLFFAILLSFMLSPVVQALEFLHLPRAMAALISGVGLLGWPTTTFVFHSNEPSRTTRSV